MIKNLSSSEEDDAPSGLRSEGFMGAGGGRVSSKRADSRVPRIRYGNVAEVVLRHSDRQRFRCMPSVAEGATNSGNRRRATVYRGGRETGGACMHVRQFQPRREPIGHFGCSGPSPDGPSIV